MTVSQEEENELVADIIRWPGNHLALNRGDEYRPDGRIFITRNGLRTYLHRWLYQRVIGPLAPSLFLLRTCQHEFCLNPYHHEVSATPLLNRCRNRHDLTGVPRDARGRRTCPECALLRAQNRPRRGGDPNWVQEQRKRFCPWGHEYTPENTYKYPTKNGGVHRKCKTCTILRSAGKHPANVGGVE